MGIVLQNPADNLLEELTARQQVELAPQLRGVDRGPAAELLDVVGMADARSSLPSQLSGGEQQRVAFAAAAIGRPLAPSRRRADRPARRRGGPGADRCDAATSSKTGTTLVVTSHDAAVIQAADHVVHLRDGRVAR